MRTLLVMLLLSAGFLSAQMRKGTLTEINGLMALPIADDAAKHAGDNGFIFWYAQNHDVLFYQSFDGKTTYTYQTKQVEAQLVNEYHNWSDYASDGSSVYILWNYNPVVHVILSKCKISRFDIDGQYRGTVPLDGDYSACHNVALADGKTLAITATATDKTPFIGLFKTNGQLIRRIDLAGDLRMTEDKDKKLEPLEFRDDFILDSYEQMSLLDNDGEGNVVLTRRYLPNEGEEPQPTVVFMIDRNGRVKHFVLERPKSKYGKTFVTRPYHQHFVTIGSERTDASDPARIFLRVYDFKGKLLNEQRLSINFGFMLTDWNEHRALFLTQAGDPTLKVRHLGLIEALPE